LKNKKRSRSLSNPWTTGLTEKTIEGMGDGTELRGQRTKNLRDEPMRVLSKPKWLDSNREQVQTISRFRSDQESINGKKEGELRNTKKAG